MNYAIIMRRFSFFLACYQRIGFSFIDFTLLLEKWALMEQQSGRLHKCNNRLTLMDFSLENLKTFYTRQKVKSNCSSNVQLIMINYHLNFNFKTFSQIKLSIITFFATFKWKNHYFPKFNQNFSKTSKSNMNIDLIFVFLSYS